MCLSLNFCSPDPVRLQILPKSPLNISKIRLLSRHHHLSPPITVVVLISLPDPLLVYLAQGQSSVLKNLDLIMSLSCVKAFSNSLLPWMDIPNPWHGSPRAVPFLPSQCSLELPLLCFPCPSHAPRSPSCTPCSEHSFLCPWL